MNWPAANLPSKGMNIVGNLLMTPNPLVGFTHTSPRVNSKANIGNSGLLSETPIVP